MMSKRSILQAGSSLAAKLQIYDSNHAQNERLELREKSTKSFCEHFRLAENPFGVTPDPRYLYDSWTHHQALNALVSGVQSGIGFQSLIALPGMGKTTVLFRLLEQFEPVACTAFLFQTQCSSREFLQYLLSELDSPSTGHEMVEMHETLHRVVLRESKAGRRVIVVIDEAQNLEPSVLETVRLLSDFETKQEKLMQIILAGQPQLQDNLTSPQLAQLYQRIPIMARLVPLGPGETKRYIRHRLMVAGHDAELFTAEASEMAWRYSQGIPRNINTLCFNALLLAHSLNQDQIDRSIVREVVTEKHSLATDEVASEEWSGGLQIVRPARDWTEKAVQEGRQGTTSDDALQVIVERARLVTAATGAAIGLQEGNHVVCHARSGSATPPIGARVSLDSGLTGECARTKKILRCNDTELDPRVDAINCRQLGVRSIVSIPLRKNAATVGIIQIFSDRPNAFDNVHLLKLQSMLEEMSPTTSGAVPIYKQATQVSCSSDGESNPPPESSAPTVDASDLEEKDAQNQSSAQLKSQAEPPTFILTDQPAFTQKWVIASIVGLLLLVATLLLAVGNFKSRILHERRKLGETGVSLHDTTQVQCQPVARLGHCVLTRL